MESFEKIIPLVLPFLVAKGDSSSYYMIAILYFIIPMVKWFIQKISDYFQQDSFIIYENNNNLKLEPQSPN